MYYLFNRILNFLVFRAFLIVLNENYCNKRVLQNSYTTNLEKRVSELETDIKEIKQSLIEKCQQNDAEIEISGRPGRVHFSRVGILSFPTFFCQNRTS